MALVYSNAQITICPIPSSSCDQGFLERRGTSVQIPFQPQIKSHVVRHYNLQYDGLLSRDWLVAVGYSTSDDLCGSVWEIRDWKFQEYQSSSLIAFPGSKKTQLVTREGVSEGPNGALWGGGPVYPVPIKSIRSLKRYA